MKNALAEEGAKLAKVRNPGSIPMGLKTTALGLRSTPAPLMSQFEACKSASSRAAELSVVKPKHVERCDFPLATARRGSQVRTNGLSRL
jgi:hypothetical protein